MRLINVTYWMGRKRKQQTEERERERKQNQKTYTRATCSRQRGGYWVMHPDEPDRPHAENSVISWHLRLQLGQDRFVLSPPPKEADWTAWLTPTPAPLLRRWHP